MVRHREEEMVDTLVACNDAYLDSTACDLIYLISCWPAQRGRKCRDWSSAKGEMKDEGSRNVSGDGSSMSIFKICVSWTEGKTLSDERG